MYFTPFVCSSRIWYYHDYKFTPQKIFLMRGGRNLRVEAQTLGNTRYVYWVESQFIRPLTADKMRFDDRDNADFLTEEGQLKYDLDVEAEEFKLWGVNLNVTFNRIRMSNCTLKRVERSITLSFSRLR